MFFARGKVCLRAEKYFRVRKCGFARGKVFFRAEKYFFCARRSAVRLRAEKYVLRKSMFCARKSIFARGKVFLRAEKSFCAR